MRPFAYAGRSHSLHEFGFFQTLPKYMLLVSRGLSQATSLSMRNMYVTTSTSNIDSSSARAKKVPRLAELVPLRICVFGCVWIL